MSVHWRCPLNSRCPLYRASVNRGSTVNVERMQSVGFILNNIKDDTSNQISNTDDVQKN